MNSILIFFATTLFSIFSNTQQDILPKEHAVSTYYLIRHAEKNRSDMAGDPELTEKGLQRAENWAEVFKDVHFDAVYSTNYRRTIQTATPTANANNLEVQIYDPHKLYSEDFRKVTTGKTVLVVGHSNTTPQFVNAILKESKYSDIDDSENGALFIVEVLEDGTKTSKVLYIN